MADQQQHEHQHHSNNHILSLPPNRHVINNAPVPAPDHPLADLAAEVAHSFAVALNPAALSGVSRAMASQLAAAALNPADDAINMLPSFTHALPDGREAGAFVVLDVGGSTLRVGLVRLAGRGAAPAVVDPLRTFAIDEHVKALPGTAFFDWLAAQVAATLAASPDLAALLPEPVPLGMSWSFPIDQTSIRSGRVLSMGKGFRCSDTGGGVVGADLAALVEAAAARHRPRPLAVRVAATVNDGAAALLARAYTDPATRVSLILGTGTNAAVHLPLPALAPRKLAGDRRSPAWLAAAAASGGVVVNSELSTFGGAGVLPQTPWDLALDAAHMRPGFQPLEYMTTGRYLGELVRLVCVDAASRGPFLGQPRGVLPPAITAPYSLETAVCAALEADDSPDAVNSAAILQKHLALDQPPALADVAFVRHVCACVSRRAAAYLATAVHALWLLQQGAVHLDEKPAVAPPSLASVTIACDGSVINKYPRFQTTCQAFLDSLTDFADPPDLPDLVAAPPPVVGSGGSLSGPSDPPTPLSTAPTAAALGSGPRILLDLAPDTAILGAAVAVAMELAGPA